MKLSEKAMLSVLSVSQWTARKLDKAVTDKANSDHGAQSDAGRFNKRLLSKNALSDITSLATAARAYHYQRTLPWLDDGARILPALVYDEYWQAMDQQRMAFNDAVSKFLDGYNDYVADAANTLGKMFKPSEYPSRDDIERKFGFNVRLLNLPDADDFRVSVNDAAAARIRADITASTAEAFNVAVSDVLSRVSEKVSAMVERLSQSDAIFRDSLVGNVSELIDLMPALNVTGDPRIDQLAKDMRKLVRYDANALREDKTVRKAVADHAANIMAQVSAYMA